jgi:hypothetical protein
MLIRKWAWKTYDACSGMSQNILRRSVCNIMHICDLVMQGHGVGWGGNPPTYGYHHKKNKGGTIVVQNKIANKKGLAVIG